MSYSVNQGESYTLSMENSSGNQYAATIPAQPEWSQIVIASLLLRPQMKTFLHLFIHTPFLELIFLVYLLVNTLRVLAIISILKFLMEPNQILI